MNDFVRPDGKTKILWDGRNRTVQKTLEFTGSHTAAVLEERGYEPRWYMTGKEAWLRSLASGAFFPHTHAPSKAP